MHETHIDDKDIQIAGFSFHVKHNCYTTDPNVEHATAELPPSRTALCDYVGSQYLP